MATAPLTIQTKTFTALTPTFTAAAGAGSGNGFTFPNNGATDFRIKNTDGSGITATIIATGRLGGVALDDQTFAVGATTGDVTIGNLDPQAFGTTVTVEVSAATGVSAAALR
jgi:hypothetical protein